MKGSKYIGIMTTAIVIGLLVMTAPTTALQLGLGTDKSKYTLFDNTATFIATVDIEPTELAPLTQLKLKIEGETDKSCTFYANGTPIRGCSGLTITPILNGTSLELGDLFITNRGGIDFGYGYGFSSAAGVKNELTYLVKWNLTNVEDGKYGAKLSVLLENGKEDATFKTKTTKFRVDREIEADCRPEKVKEGKTKKFDAKVEIPDSVDVDSVRLRITGGSTSLSQFMKLKDHDDDETEWRLDPKLVLPNTLAAGTYNVFVDVTDEIGNSATFKICDFKVTAKKGNNKDKNAEVDSDLEVASTNYPIDAKKDLSDKEIDAALERE